jgi:hypothetical protein
MPVIAWATLDPAEHWEVHSAVVVDERAMSSKLQDVGEPVFSLDDLREDPVGLWVGNAQCRGLCTLSRR